MSHYPEPDSDNYLTTVAIAASAGVASLWPLGLAAYVTWPADASTLPGGNGVTLGIACLLGVLGCASLVTSLLFVLLRATILRDRT